MGHGIYLDNAATTFPKPECVYRAVDEAGRCYGVNAGRGSYALARKACGIIEETREMIKRLAGADDVAEVVLTASATLACNQIFGGFDWRKEDVVYVSPYEHNAVMRVLHAYREKHGFLMEELAVKEGAGELDLEKVDYQFARKNPTVVAMCHVSNVTGYILPVKQVAQAAAKYGATVVVDGAQAFGAVPFRLKNMPVDFYIFAGHKALYGPFGTGGFLWSGRVPLKPVLFGGTGSDSLNLSMREDVSGLEPGSPDIVALAGLHASLCELLEDSDGGKGSVKQIFERERALASDLMQTLSGVRGVTLYPAGECTAQAGIVSFNIDGYQAPDTGMILDADYGIAVRAGYQCAPLIHSHLGTAAYHGVVRAGIGRFTTGEEIALLVRAVREIAEG